MGWVGVSVGFNVVGGVASYFGGKSAADEQAKATAEANRIAAEQLAFQKEQYADWKDVYGDTQDNLAEFYENYDAEYVTSLGLQNIEKEYSASKQALTKEMAQRGMDTSGLTAAALTNLEYSKASNAATVRAEAPLKAAEAQQSFLSLGLGQQSVLQQGIAGAYQNQQSLYSNQAIAYGNEVAAASQGVASSISGIGSSISTYQQLSALNATSPAPSITVAEPAPTYIPNTSITYT